MGTSLFAKPLLSNGFCIFAYIAVFAQERIYLLQCFAICFFTIIQSLNIIWTEVTMASLDGLKINNPNKLAVL
jgi:hypothetical protein